MPLTAIMGGSAIFSAVEGYHASTKAATQQQQGAQQAVELEKPMSDIGNSAAARLASMYGLTVTPPSSGGGIAANRPPPIGTNTDGVLTPAPGLPAGRVVTNPGTGTASIQVPGYDQNGNYVGDGTMAGLSRRPANASSFQ